MEENKRGRECVESLEQMEMMVINGRANSDSPAEYTYVDKIGNSVIDLAICRFKDHDLIEDLRTLTLMSGSDHDAIELKPSITNKKGNVEEGICWLPWKEEDYKKELDSRESGIETAQSNNEINMKITEAISEVAKKVGMWKKSKDKGEHGCEWFDAECKKMKHEVRKEWKRMKDTKKIKMT